MDYIPIHCYRAQIAALKVLRLELEMCTPNGRSVHERANLLGTINLAIKCYEKHDLLQENCAQAIDKCYAKASHFLEEYHKWPRS